MSDASVQSVIRDSVSHSDFCITSSGTVNGRTRSLSEVSAATDCTVKHFVVENAVQSQPASFSTM
eukprot:4426162-Prymnesium_polylepis.1